MRQAQYHPEDDLDYAFCHLFIPAVLAAIMMMAPSTPADAATCKAWVSGNGQALAQPLAQSKARADWVAKTSGSYGPAWANFAQAQVGAFPCNKVGPVNWSCTVRAKPCMQDFKAVR